MGYRRLIVTVVLTAVLAALAQPLYSVGGIWTGIIKQEQQNRTARPVKNRRERQQIDIFKDVHAPFFFRPLSGRNGKVRLLCN